jgi:hypothetical protein
MKREALAALPPGTRIWRWWDSGIGADPSPFTLVRVNPKTVTVTNNMGANIRVPHAEWVGVVDWEERS